MQRMYIKLMDNSSPQNSSKGQIHVILSGVMGKAEVVQAIFNDPSVEMESVEVPGYGLRIQDMNSIGPDSVREDMASAWEGKHYMGAVGVVAATGETVRATRITTTVDAWKKANKLIKYFNYHEYGKDAANSWFHNEGVRLPGHDQDPSDIVEVFADKNGLKRVEEVYPNPNDFEVEVDRLTPVMAESIRDFRKKVIEGSTSSLEHEA